jgi:hypothetical protein
MAYLGWCAARRWRADDGPTVEVRERRYADARREEPWPSRRAALSKLEGRLRVGRVSSLALDAVIQPAKSKCPESDRLLPAGTEGRQHDDRPRSSFNVDLSLGPAITGRQLWAAADIQRRNPNGCRQSSSLRSFAASQAMMTSCAGPVHPAPPCSRATLDSAVQTHQSPLRSPLRSPFLLPCSDYPPSGFAQHPRGQRQKPMRVRHSVSGLTTSQDIPSPMATSMARRTGGSCVTRTRDQRIKSPLLYRLS